MKSKMTFVLLILICIYLNMNTVGAFVKYTFISIPTLRVSESSEGGFKAYFLSFSIYRGGRTSLYVQSPHQNGGKPYYIYDFIKELDYHFDEMYWSKNNKAVTLIWRVNTQRPLERKFYALTYDFSSNILIKPDWNLDLAKLEKEDFVEEDKRWKSLEQKNLKYIERQGGLGKIASFKERKLWFWEVTEFLEASRKCKFARLTIEDDGYFHLDNMNKL